MAFMGIYVSVFPFFYFYFLRFTPKTEYVAVVLLNCIHEVSMTFRRRGGLPGGSGAAWW